MTVEYRQLGVIQAMPQPLRVETASINVRDADEIESGAAAFSRTPNGGLILTPSGLAGVHYHLIIALAARHKLPSVYYERFFAAAGGLISYGPASYVDRILKGEKPGDLPVQAPPKYELVINI